MAASDGSSSGASQLPKSEAATVPRKIRISEKLSRRQLTLVSLTVCLNILLWSSTFVFITSLYLIASDPNDSANIPSYVLTITSAVASIGYIIVHTIFSLKQRIWKHQRRHPSILKKTSYVAVRIAVTLCILWLLTAGWNMITVARRPVCLPAGPGLAGWEVGSTCIVGRITVAFSCIALIVSCTLFGMLAVWRRPFEVHVFKHGHREDFNPFRTPAPSRRPSRSRSISASPEKQHGRRISASTHRTRNSESSNTDVETLNLDTPPFGPTAIHAPSPIRSMGLGVFTSQAQPPPIPAAYHPYRSSSVDIRSTPAFVQPTSSRSYSQINLSRPSRMGSLANPAGCVPLSIPVQYSHSAWRAVHPNLPFPLRPAASRSHPHLPLAAAVSGPNVSIYRNRYSRSSVSLTRPHRLSTANPLGSIEWSSNSGSTGPFDRDDGRGSPSKSEREDADGVTNMTRASASDIAYAILNGTAIPGTHLPNPQLSAVSLAYKKGHVRRASAPDATCGAVDVQTPAMASIEEKRMAKGWKPRLQGQFSTSNLQSINYMKSGKRVVRSSSAQVLSRFSPDSSLEEDGSNLRKELEKELESKEGGQSKYDIPSYEDTANFLKSFRSSIVGRIMGDAKVVKGTSDDSEDAVIGATAEQDVVVHEKKGDKEKEKEGVGENVGMRKRRMTLEEAMNKPLPKIGVL